MLAVVIGEGVDKGWATDAFLNLGRGTLVGIAIGGAGGWLVRRAQAAGWTTTMSDQLVVLGLALLSYGTAVQFDGNGFVAAFLAGLVFGAASGGRLERATEFTDTVGLFSSFVVWIIFGAAFVGPVLRGGIHFRPVLYAVLSLTIVRMLPVTLALVGVHLRRDTVAFVGWFGPRGLASVVFTLIAFDALAGFEIARALTELTTWTILLSVLCHGLSSGPLAALYGRRLKVAPADTPELALVAHPDCASAVWSRRSSLRRQDVDERTHHHHEHAHRNASARRSSSRTRRKRTSPLLARERAASGAVRRVRPELRRAAGRSLPRPLGAAASGYAS